MYIYPNTSQKKPEIYTGNRYTYTYTHMCMHIPACTRAILMWLVVMTQVDTAV